VYFNYLEDFNEMLSDLLHYYNISYNYTILCQEVYFLWKTHKTPIGLRQIIYSKPMYNIKKEVPVEIVKVV
jgi:hypothetical protein